MGLLSLRALCTTPPSFEPFLRPGGIGEIVGWGPSHGSIAFVVSQTASMRVKPDGSVFQGLANTSGEAAGLGGTAGIGAEGHFSPVCDLGMWACEVAIRR